MNGFFTEVLLPFFLIIFGVFGGIFLICDVAQSNACDNYHEITGKRVLYKHFDECYIETKQGWQRWDEYKARSTAADAVE